MIILLSKDKELKKQIKKVDNIQHTTNIYDCQTLLSSENMECDILILALDLIKEYYQIFFTWIIEKNFFIRTILIYYDDKNIKIPSEFYTYLGKLEDARYVNNIVNKDKLIDAIKLL
jgi:hypothetical protein